MALVLPELQIQTVLDNGFKVLPTEPDLLDDLLKNYPPEMIVEAKKYLTEHRIVTCLNWPREGLTLPIVAIVNAGDSEAPDKDLLGDFISDELGSDDNELVEMQGTAKQGNYQMLCLAQDPRLALHISLFVESLLILNTEELQKAGMHNILINSSDLRFEEQLLPEWTNSRLVSLSCLHYHAIAVTSRILKALVVETTPAKP